MVKYQDHRLDRTFAALADPTRRALLARLGDQPSLSVSELAQPFAMSLPAIMKHLDVLSDAGLIRRTKTGRTVACRLTAAPMEQAMEWINRYQRFWSAQLDRLAAFVEEEPCPPTQLRHQTQSYHQAPAQRAAGESLRRLDGPGENSALVRTGAGRDAARGSRRARRRPLPYRHAHVRRRGARRRRQLPRGGAERKAGLHLGLAQHAGTGIAGDGHAQGRRRRHAADLDCTSNSSTKPHATATTSAGAGRSTSSRSIWLDRKRKRGATYATVKVDKTSACCAEKG